ncbi:MAG: porin family protein [Acidobacteria bacterium]|nr:porin family protein [Acidobacteriota bacterium]
MRKLFMAALLIASTAPFAFAQTGDDYNKVDVGVLYSHNRVDTGFDDPSQNFIEEREGFHGVEAFVKGNVSRYVGLKGSYSFNRKSFDITGGTPATTFNVDADLHQFLGGAEFKDNAKETKVKPFAHVMAGVAHAKADVSGLPALDDSETGFAGVIGGGVDFRISDRVDFRAFQFDYNPNRANGETSHNFRIGIGFIFR